MSHFFCKLRESENTCKNTRFACNSRMSVCFLTRATCRNVRQNLIPRATAYPSLSLSMSSFRIREELKTSSVVWNSTSHRSFRLVRREVNREEGPLGRPRQKGADKPVPEGSITSLLDEALRDQHLTRSPFTTRGHFGGDHACA